MLKRAIRVKLRTGWEEAKLWLLCRDAKPFSRQMRELVGLWKRYRYPPYQYLKHRLYRADCDEDVGTYMPPVLVRRYRDRVNPPAARERTRDKLLFEKAMARHGLNTVATIAGIMRDGSVVAADQATTDYAGLIELLTKLQLEEVFIKPAHGCEGRGAKKMQFADGALHFAGERLNADGFMRGLFALPDYHVYVVQPVVAQHALLSEMNPGSVNTIRIDALVTGENTVEHSGACLRVGAGTGFVDNASAGGLCVIADLETGRLEKYARSLPMFGNVCVETHPLTGFRFADAQLPGWDEAKKMVRAGTLALAPLRYIGWDVAFGPDGPILMEASSIHDIFGLQCILRGLGDKTIARVVMQERAGIANPD